MRPHEELLREIRLLQAVAKLHAAAMDTALGGGDPDPEGGGDLGVREPCEIAQDDCFAVLEWKLGERREDTAPEIGSFCRSSRVVVGARIVSAPFDHRELDGGNRPAPRAPESGIDPDPVEPREERSVGTVAVQVAPRLDEGILNRFLDVSRVVQNAQEDDAQATLVPPHDLRERIHISALRQAHEIGIGLLAGRHPGIVRFRNEATILCV